MNLRRVTTEEHGATEDDKPVETGILALTNLH
jgi:hypothetical protein